MSLGMLRLLTLDAALVYLDYKLQQIVSGILMVGALSACLYFFVNYQDIQQIESHLNFILGTAVGVSSWLRLAAVNSKPPEKITKIEVYLDIFLMWFCIFVLCSSLISLLEN